MAIRLTKSEIITMKKAVDVKIYETETSDLGVSCYKILLIMDDFTRLCNPEYLTLGSVRRSIRRFRPEIEPVFAN